MSTWIDQPENTGGGTQFFFKIDDTFLFLIDNTYKFVIDDTADVLWTDLPEN